MVPHTLNSEGVESVKHIIQIKKPERYRSGFKKYLTYRILITWVKTELL